MTSLFGFFSFNNSFLSGAMDMIAIKYPDGSFKMSPLRVRFGQFKVLNAKEKNVQLFINDKKVDLELKLTQQGEVYVLKERKQKVISNFSDNGSCGSDGYASPSADLGKSAPTSPREPSYEDAYDELSIHSIRKRKKVKLIRRKSSFELFFHQRGYKTVKENSFTIEKAYDKVINENNMKISLSNSWNLIKKNRDAIGRDLEVKFNDLLFKKEDFFNDPWKILNNDNLAVKYDDNIYTWKVVAPLIISQLAFRETLPDSTIQKLTAQRGGFLMWRKVDVNANRIILKEKKKLHSTSTENLVENINSNAKNDEVLNLTNLSDSEKAINIPEKLKGEVKNDDLTPKNRPRKRSQFKKTRILTSDQIKLLNLKYGKNTIKFVVSSSVQGTQELSSELYLWNYDDKLVVSDFDGTITRTDVIGQIFPLFFGTDWSHKGVVKLYNNISRNGYKILYLTARSICQHTQTKKYLTSLTQEGEKMPEGPILMSPEGLFSSFQREVLEGAPQLFKISCLTQVQNLFPAEEVNPFYAGFGNKQTDVLSYNSLNIPNEKIFIINEKGQVSSPGCKIFKSTYKEMNENVNELFPYTKGYNTYFYNIDYYNPKPKNVNIDELFN